MPNTAGLVAALGLNLHKALYGYQRTRGKAKGDGR